MVLTTVVGLGVSQAQNLATPLTLEAANGLMCSPNGAFQAQMAILKNKINADNLEFISGQRGGGGRGSGHIGGGIGRVGGGNRSGDRGGRGRNGGGRDGGVDHGRNGDWHPRHGGWDDDRWRYAGGYIFWWGWGVPWYPGILVGGVDLTCHAYYGGEFSQCNSACSNEQVTCNERADEAMCAPLLGDSFYQACLNKHRADADPSCDESFGECVSGCQSSESSLWDCPF